MRLVRRLSFTSLFSLLLGGVIHRFGGTVEGLNFLESSKSSEEDLFKIKKPLELRDTDIADVEELDEETKGDLENVDLKNETGLVLLNKTDLDIENITEEIPILGSHIESADIELREESIQEQPESELTVVIVEKENGSGGVVLEKISFEDFKSEENTADFDQTQTKNIELIKAVVSEEENSLQNGANNAALVAQESSFDTAQSSTSLVISDLSQIADESSDTVTITRIKEEENTPSVGTLGDSVNESQEKSTVFVSDKARVEGASTSGDPTKEAPGQSIGGSSNSHLRHSTRGSSAVVKKPSSKGKAKSLQVRKMARLRMTFSK